MAKKQSEPKKSDTKQAEPANPVAKKPVTPTPQDARRIDTSNAASAAAAMVGNKAPLPAGGAKPKKESAAFKQLKAGLNKPSAGAFGGAFGTPGQIKKTNQTHGGGKQAGHSQTFGADVNRAGVPRRTPG